MLQQIFCVYDSAAQRYLDPWLAPTLEFALRSFREAVNRPDHHFNKFPADYTLFHLGEWDGERGKYHLLETPHNLGVAITLVESPIQLEADSA